MNCLARRKGMQNPMFFCGDAFKCILLCGGNFSVLQGIAGTLVSLLKQFCRALFKCSEKRSRLPAPWWPLCIKRARWLGWVPFQICVRWSYQLRWWYISKYRKKKNENVKQLNSAKSPTWFDQELSFLSVCRWDSRQIRPWSTFDQKHVYTLEMRVRVLSRDGDTF